MKVNAAQNSSQAPSERPRPAPVRPQVGYLQIGRARKVEQALNRVLQDRTLPDLTRETLKVIAHEAELLSFELLKQVER